MGKTKCEYNYHETGKQAFFDGTTYETLVSMHPIDFYDDFLGADVVIPDFASPESGCKWVWKDISAAGTPTVAKLANAINGVVEIDLDATVEVQTAEVDFGDQLIFSLSQGLIFEARVSMSVLPSGAAARGIFGVGGAWVAEGAAVRAGFEILTAGAINAESDDAITDIPGATGVTAVASTYNIFRIDATTISDIKFYIDGARVAASTTFANAAAASANKVQPYFGCTKTADAAQATMLCDYIKIWQNRA